MDKVCKKYISDIKTLFPTMGRQERAYIKKLRTAVTEYCSEAPAVSLDNLYKDFGKPEDILNTYLKYVDTEYLIKRMSISRYIKSFILILLICCAFATTFYAIHLHYVYEIFAENQKFSD